jgi:hypothetical protein
MAGYQFKTFKFSKKDCPIGYSAELQSLEQRMEALRGLVRPAINPDAEYLTIASEDTLPTTAAKFMDYFMNTPGDKLVPGTSSVPAITGSLLVSSEWGKPGCRRILQDANGDDTIDELIAVSPNCVEYMGYNFTGQGRKVMSFVIGRIDLVETGDNHLKVTWTYRVSTIGWIGKTVGRFIMAPTLRSFHKAGLNHWKSQFQNK